MSSPHPTDGSPNQPAPRPGFSSLNKAVCGFVARGLAPSTRAVYWSATNHYDSFCAQFNLSSLPLTQDTLTCFVAYLAHSGMTYQSIRIYVSGIRFLHIARGLPDPLMEAFPILDYFLHGNYQCPLASPRQPHHPITPNMLRALFSAWSSSPGEAIRCSSVVGGMLRSVLWVHAGRRIQLAPPGMRTHTTD